MADLGRGVKAGIVAGVIMGLIGGVITVALMMTVFHDEYAMMYQAIAEQTIAESGEEMPMDVDEFTGMMMTIGVVGVLIMSPIIGAVIGVIFGLIYAALYDKLPGKTPIVKGLVIGMAYFVIAILLGLVSSAIFAADIEISATVQGVDYIVNLLTALIFGYLLGVFWIKFEPK